MHINTHWPLTAPVAYACCHMCPCSCFSAPTLRSLAIIQRTDAFAAASASLRGKRHGGDGVLLGEL